MVAEALVRADAVKLGISRALVEVDEASPPLLRENDLLTVDSRVKERKKYGQKAAQKVPTVRKTIIVLCV